MSKFSLISKITLSYQNYKHTRQTPPTDITVLFFQNRQTANMAYDIYLTPVDLVLSVTIFLYQISHGLILFLVGAYHQITGHSIALRYYRGTKVQLQT